MKRYESKHNPAVAELSQLLNQGSFNDAIPPLIKAKITNVLEGIKHTDEMISQKEQLLVQKERELDRLKSITDNSSNVARNIINESKGNLDKATDLLNSGKFSEALKYSDIALYNVEDIDNLGLQTIAQANNLYLERKQQYVEAAAKRDDFYKQGVINGVNAFSWVKDNPTRDFYTFFRETLKVSDKSPENVNLINNRLYHNLPKYLQEAQRANHFYNEYNKYHDVLLKLQQVINIYNIKAASSKGLKDYEDALKSCEIALEIEPTSTTLVNLKNAILQEKQVEEANKLEENNLLVSKTQEIETLRELLAQKEVETQEKNKLLTQKGNELVSTEKVLIDKHQKETEALKALLAHKELEHQELLARKDKEVKELEKVKNEFLKKELLEILPQAYPSDKSSGYNKPFSEWDSSWYGKKVIDTNNFESIKSHLPGLREKAARIKEENLKKQAKELENTKKLEEENLKKEELLGSKDKLLSDKEQEIAKFKELLSIKEIETKNKDQLLFAKELETGELLAQKEKENKELLALKEKQAKELENAKKLQEENIKKEQLLSNKDKLLSDKEQRIEELKALIEQSKIEKEELLAKQELAVANKSHIKNQIIDELREEVNLKENEVVDLRIQNLEKELITQQKEKLLIQKDEEVRNKSLVKNQIIGGLREAMNEKEKEALYSQIELLKKQLEFKDKEAEDARIISELKDQLLTLKALYGHDVSFAEEFSAIQFRAENSIANNDFGDIADLSRYISRLVEAERDNSVSADFSNLLANISPINHGEEQPIYRSIYIEDRSVQPGESLAERQMESLDLSSMMNQDRQNQVLQTGESLIAGEQMSVPLNQGNIMNHGAQNQNLIGNFDIDNQHITHSVLLSGSVEVSIIEDESI